MKHSTKILALLAAFAAAGALGHAATASDNWSNNCAKCHGADGKGETKIGRKLRVKDYTDAKVQAAVTDAQMENAITNGVQEHGRHVMKAFKSDLSPAEIKDLVAFMRKFKA